MQNITTHIQISYQQELQNLMKIFNSQPPLNKKIKQRKQFILLKLPLFMTIFQKKGQQNFQLIVNQIKLTKYQFGNIILSNQCLKEPTDIDDQAQQKQRTFNYIFKGSAMMFTVKENQHNPEPQFYKKIGQNQYFGQKLSFGNDKLFEVKAVSSCFILQLNINTFYNAFSGHFQYAQLKDKLSFLQQIWLFSQIRRSSIQKILLLSQNAKYKKNHVLFKKGDIPQNFYVIISGELAYFQKKVNQKVKYLPFCLLNRAEVCGFQEMVLQKAFQCNGIVTSQILEVMIIKKDLYLKFLQPYMVNKIDTINQLWTEKQKLKSMSINYEKQYKQVVEHSKRKQNQLFKMLVRSFVPKKPPRIEVQNVQLSFNQQLKNPAIRQFRLKQIKQKQNCQFNSSSLSSITNNNYTKDKKLLINYLMKKQKIQRKAHVMEFNYQRSLSSQSGIVSQIHVKDSSAVKNQKRKLFRSRYQSVSAKKL